MLLSCMATSRMPWLNVGTPAFVLRPYGTLTDEEVKNLNVGDIHEHGWRPQHMTR